MPASAPLARVVLTTAADAEQARRLGRQLVEERLAACATLLPGAESIYRWQGRIESSAETVLLLKTDPEHLAALAARLHELHSYETPEFLVLPIDSGSPAYLNWLHAALEKA